MNLTNEPSVSFTLEVMKNILYAIKVSSAFSKADKNPNIRQLYEVSQLGELNKEKIITPKWMQLKAQKNQKKDFKDFREELSIEEGKAVILDIFVANKMIKEKKNWQKIGIIRFKKSQISSSCDHRLHFHHPVWRDDLDYESGE